MARLSSSKAMARFLGNFDQFYQWADTRTRFWITQKTKEQRVKARQNGCPGCGSTSRVLTAAHREKRKLVVQRALGVTDPKMELDIDLEKAWKQIKDAHRPFDRTFQYLCEPCHIKLDQATAAG